MAQVGPPWQQAVPPPQSVRHALDSVAPDSHSHAALLSSAHPPPRHQPAQLLTSQARRVCAPCAGPAGTDVRARAGRPPGAHPVPCQPCLPRLAAGLCPPVCRRRAYPWSGLQGGCGQLATGTLLQKKRRGSGARRLQRRQRGSAPCCCAWRTLAGWPGQRPAARAPARLRSA